MTQAGASGRYRFDVAEAINYNFYHLVLSSRISLVRSLMKRRKRGQSMSSIRCRNFNFFHRSCVVYREWETRGWFLREFSVKFVRLSPSYVSANNGNIRSVNRWRMTLKLWKLPTLAEVPKTKPSPSRLFARASKETWIEKRWKRDERHGGHKSTRELRFFFSFYASLVSCTQSPSSQK